VCTPATHACTAPSCTDGVKDQDETDVDCGGSHCSACGGGKMCLMTSDCAWPIPCTNNVCCHPQGDLCSAGVNCCSGTCVGVCL
jgi:hypothetical protein